MQISHTLVFDDYVQPGEDPQYTADRFCDALGAWGFTLFALGSQSSGSYSGIIVSAQHSADKITWVHGSTLVDVEVAGPMWLKYHSGSAPYVRLKVEHFGGNAMRLRLWATARCLLRVFECGADDMKQMGLQSCSCK